MSTLTLENKISKQNSVQPQVIPENFRFVNVEDFFDDYKNQWSEIGDVVKSNINTNKNQIEMCFNNSENKPCWLLLRFATPNSFRLRFNPGKESIECFNDANTRTIVKDTFDELDKSLDKVIMSEIVNNDQVIEYDILNAAHKKIMKIEINLKPYNLTVYKYKNNKECFKVYSDNYQSIYYKKRLINAPDRDPIVEYSCINVRNKPVSARYIGFGEKPGANLCKNNKQLTYFNFDNMMYKQIYNNGCCEDREPLYHSDPFFMEFNGVSDEESVYGTFIDNSSETFVDLGCADTTKYMLGTMYGDLDVYFFLSEDCQGVLKTLVQYIGTTKLKPRFALGYHQGCYGYESLKGSPYGKDLLTVAKKHRENGIPLDGIHVDVDIQKNYCTFTMDENKFPSDTFNQLEDLGIKCSTNITPVVSYLNNDYQTYKSGKLNDFFIHDKSDKPYYKGGVYYGNDYGTLGHYSDFGNKDVRAWWGQQYKLLYERGLKMVWQDMTSPDIPDHIGLANNTIKGPDGTCYRIGDVIESGWRSLPLELKLTDNFYKRYSNACDGADVLNYEGRIRNLYSYNLHKATYHGLDNIWFINCYTFLDIDGVDKAESKSILDELISRNVVYLTDDGSGGFEKYLLNDNWQSNINKCNLSKKSEVIKILQQAQNLRKLRENKRNYIIGRGGFTGMHRFAGLWTGDNASTWDFLRINIAQALASGITGQSMTGADIGGFEQNGSDKWADPQLLMRWTLLGSFIGWFRNHYNGKADKKWFQEPYMYGQDWVLNMVPWNERHLYKAVLPVCRRYIHIRYQLMQLLYDAMFENTITGMPIARALFLTMKDAALFNDKLDFINNEFTIGNDLLAAPVLTQQKTDTDGIRDVYLPYISDDYYGNRWYCYQHNKYKLEKAISGGTTISYDASFRYSWGQTNPDDDKHLDFLVPLFVKAGAIIPTVKAENYVGELNENPVTINIYPGPSGKYSMYLDDGISRSSAHPDSSVDPTAKGEHRQMDIKHSYSSIGNRSISIKWPHNNYIPNEKYFYVAILHDPLDSTINSINLSKKNMSYTEGQLEFLGSGGSEVAKQLENSTKNAWYFNSDINISFIKIFTPDALKTLSQDDYAEDKIPEIILDILYN